MPQAEGEVELVAKERRSESPLIAWCVAIAVWFLAFGLQIYENTSEDPTPSVLQVVLGVMALIAVAPAAAAGFITLGVLRWRRSSRISN
jgi:hypothetical protein